MKEQNKIYLIASIMILLFAILFGADGEVIANYVLIMIAIRFIAGKIQKRRKKKK